MQVIDFIKEKGVEALTTELGIKVKTYEDHEIVVLNYCQIDSPKTHPIVRECRGLILNRLTHEVYARPFERFFNYGEAPETTEGFELTRAIAYEKIDGSLIKIWFNPQAKLWECGTRGTAFAESDCQGHGVTFRELIHRSLNVADHEQFDAICRANLDPNVTYLCELTSKENRVVTLYEGTTLWYLGAVQRETGQDLSASVRVRDAAMAVGCQLIGQRGFSNIDECLNTAASLPDLNEGYVLHDTYTNIRIKVKSPAYVAVHHIRGEGLTPKRVKQLVLTNELAEYLLHFPEDEAEFEHTVLMKLLLENNIVEAYDMNSGHLTQKDFALAVKDFCFSHVLFQARAKDKHPLDVWNAADAGSRYKTLCKFMNADFLEE